MPSLRLALACVLLFVTFADAKDFCFNPTSPPTPDPPNDRHTHHRARFTPPAKNKCKPVVGFERASTVSNPAKPVDGTVCMNSTWTRLRAGFLIHAAAFVQPGGAAIVSNAINVGMDLPFLELAGGALLVQLTTATIARFDGIAGPMRVHLRNTMMSITQMAGARPH